MEITLFYRVRPLNYSYPFSPDLIEHERAETDLKCPTTQFRSPPILVSIIIHWSIDYMGNNWNLDILGCCYVSLLYPLHNQKLTHSEHSPGSLREPMHTSLWPAHGMVKLGTTFGLIAAAVRSTYVKEPRS